MITNTCLTGGSFELEVLGAGADDPLLPAPSLLPLPAPALDGEEAPVTDFAPDLAGVEAGVEVAADGVGSDSAGGGSLGDDGEASGVEVGVEVDAVGAADGRISFTCRASEASVSCTGEPTTPPRTTPKARNINTSAAEIRDEGSARPDQRDRCPPARMAAGGATAAGPTLPLPALPADRSASPRV
jgi:hypothetical protein